MGSASPVDHRSDPGRRDRPGRILGEQRGPDQRRHQPLGVKLKDAAIPALALRRADALASTIRAGSRAVRPPLPGGDPGLLPAQATPHPARLSQRQGDTAPRAVPTRQIGGAQEHHRLAPSTPPFRLRTGVGAREAGPRAVRPVPTSELAGGDTARRATHPTAHDAHPTAGTESTGPRAVPTPALTRAELHHPLAPLAGTRGAWRRGAGSRAVLPAPLPQDSRRGLHRLSTPGADDRDPATKGRRRARVRAEWSVLRGRPLATLAARRAVRAHPAPTHRLPVARRAAVLREAAAAAVRRDRGRRPTLGAHDRRGALVATAGSVRAPGRTEAPRRRPASGGERKPATATTSALSVPGAHP